MKNKKIIPLLLASLFLVTSCNDGSNTSTGDTTDTQSQSGVSSISLDRSSVTANPGDNFTLTATVEAEEGVDKSVIWTTNNSNVADVTNAGRVFVTNSAKNYDAAVITATSVVDPSKYAVCTVVVTTGEITPSIDLVTLSETSKSVYAGTTFTLTATVTGSGAFDNTVSWSTSKSSVATVDNGVVSISSSALPGDTVLITATSNQDTSKTDSCVISVIEEVVPLTPAEAKTKIDNFVTDIKTKHNYRMHMSAYSEDDVEDIVELNFINIDDKACYVEDDTGSTGVIYQKNQGYVMFDRYYKGNIIPDYFASTNVEATASEVMPTSLEQVLKASYTQDTTNTNRFKITDKTAIAVALNQTGYVNVVMTIAPSEMYLSVDNSDTSFYINIDFRIALNAQFYDAHASFVVSSIGYTRDEVVEAYVANPTQSYVAPTSWSEDNNNLFIRYFNNYIPPFMSGATFSFDMYEGGETQRYDGMHFFIDDYDSGDLTSSYGTKLITEGFAKQEDGTYLKVVNNEVTSTIDNYKIIPTYIAPSVQVSGQPHPIGYYFPNGIFSLEFHYNETSDVYSVEKMNEYLTKNDLRRYVPLYNEGNSTKISNFRDRTEAMNSLFGDYYIFYTSTDFIKIYYDNPNKAKEDVNAYIEALKERGYTKTEKGSSIITLTYPDSGSTDSFVIITDPDSITSSTTYIMLQYSIYKFTNIPVDPYGPVTKVLSSISVSGQTTQYEKNDTFTFDGTLTAHYSDGSSEEVTPTSVSSPDMTTSGAKQIIITYKENGVTRTVTYYITVKGSGEYVITYHTFLIEGEQFIERDDLMNLSSSTLPSSGEYSNIINIKIVPNDGYTFDHFEFPWEYYDDEYFMEYLNEMDYDMTETEFSLRISEFDIDIYLAFEKSGSKDTYSVSFDSDSHVSNIVSSDLSEVEAGTKVTFSVNVEDGYEIDTVTSSSSDVIIVSENSGYAFTMPNHDVVISVSTKVVQPSSTYKISFVTDSHITKVNTSVYGYDPNAVEAGYHVTFSVNIQDGYEIKAVICSDSETSIHQNEMQSTSFDFWMPAKNITITIQTKSSGGEVDTSLQMDTDYNLVIPRTQTLNNIYSLRFSSDGTGTYTQTREYATYSDVKTLSFRYTLDANNKLSFILISGDKTDFTNGYRLFDKNDAGYINNMGMLNSDGTITATLIKEVTVSGGSQNELTEYTFSI